MLIILFRVVIIYLFVLLYLRLMGKRQLGEMQPFELVITFIIADIATVPMANISMPLLHGLIPLTALVLLHFAVSLVSRKSIVLRKILNGKPVIVISPDGIQYDALKSLNMSFDDLSEGMRTAGYIKIEEIQYAVVETNGSFNVIPKAENSPVVNKDMKLKVPEISMPTNLVTAGKIMHENVKLMKVDREFLITQLEKMGSYRLKDIMLLSMDSDGKMFMQPFKGQYLVHESGFKGGEG